MVIFLTNEVSIAEMNNIIKRAKKVKIKCFEKKKQYALFILSPASEEVEENEKKTPKKNNTKKPKRIFLSIFLQQLLNSNLKIFFDIRPT